MFKRKAYNELLIWKKKCNGKYAAALFYLHFILI
mgnify:CR=1 FL=1